MMHTPNYSEFLKLTKKGNLIPIWREIPADLDTPVSAFLKIRKGRHSFLMESMEGGEKWGRYSFLGTEPKLVFKSRGLQARVTQGGKTTTLPVARDPLDTFKMLLSVYRPVEVPELPRFSGGAVGYMAYDMARYLERLPATAKDEAGLDDCFFLVVDTVLIFDNLRQSIFVVSHVFIPGGKKPALRVLYNQAVRKIEQMIRRLRRPLAAPRTVPHYQVPKLKVKHTETEFCRLVERAKEYIRAGDIFQVQVSTRFTGKATIPPFELYRTLRRVNPSPYLYYLELDGMAIVGASPELMVRLTEDRVELRPIAGTRRRGKDVADDERLKEELVHDPKERAEHIMLVDLGRNDLGRVSAAGTVKVDELEVVEKYSHVMHLVSHVSGKLKAGCDAYDVLRASFPAGTLTGAPKVRAMQIIEELEGVRRGIYGGCVGYIGFNGNTDMAITIRTALFHKGQITVQAAGGIVYDSVPKWEYQECHNKARAMMAALEKIGM